VALGSIQPLTEFSTRDIAWGVKGGRCTKLTNFVLSCADYLEILESLTLGNARVSSGL